jgi:serine/threonine-protein kinase
MPEHSLVWLDRKGHVEPAAPDGRAFSPNFDLSPDGTRAALPIRADDDTTQLWVYHLATGQWQRLTSAEAHSLQPVWSSDGRRIAFSSNADGAFSLYLVDADGEMPPERLTEPSQIWRFPYSWSPDGRFIAYQEQNSKTVWNTFILPLEGDRKPWLWDKEGAAVTVPAFSPDGRWLAYRSSESGRPEVYVRPFPGPGRKARISGQEGGFGPRWSPDGREILYLPESLADNRILAARVEPGEVMRVTDRYVAFAPPFPTLPNVPAHYRVGALSPDGQRLLTIRPDPQSVDPITFGELHAVTSFAQEVKAKVAKK